jgi:hypothetical protein
MPPTAAIDNETLDHLLSVTGPALAALDRPEIAMFSTIGENSDCRTLPGGDTLGAHYPPHGRVTAAPQIASLSRNCTLASGCNYQAGPWVVGAQADFGWSLDHHDTGFGRSSIEG